MDASILTALASHGLPGLIIAALAAWVLRLHGELRDERRARIDDAKEGFDVLLKMQEKTHDTSDKLFDVMKELKERDLRDPRRRF